MIFNHIYRIGLEDCGKDNEATNKAILTILEDIAGLHSATVGLGLNEINETGYAWVVLKWQVQIIKRPRYNDELNVYTWSTSVDKLFAERDFKVIVLIPSNIRLPISAWNKNNRMITLASRLFHFLTSLPPSSKTDQNVQHVPVTASSFHCIA